VIEIAWPIVLSNLSVPLLGLVDTAVIGHLGDAALIGAIAVGAMIFSFLYWGFGFLRMGTTGLIAQASGAGDPMAVTSTLQRALLIGGAIGVMLVVLQLPLSSLSFRLLQGSEEVESAAAQYFAIRIWGGPANLINLVVLGFFLGLQDSRTALKLQLTLNCINILLDLVFVPVLGWGVAGVAAATLIAEYSTLVLGLLLIARHFKHRHLPWKVPRTELFDLDAVKHTLVVNRDIMIRTLCLIFAFAWFTDQGARSGDVILAVNAILMQLVSFAAFFLDGFALAAESLVGAAVGSGSRSELKRSVRYSSELAVMTAVVLSILYGFTAPYIVAALTNVESVRQTATVYLPWAIASPILSVWCYQLDGIFIGATRTREMRNAMLLSLAIFLLSWWVLGSGDVLNWGNHGLWAALMLYFVVRALTLAANYRRVLSFGELSSGKPAPGERAQPRPGKSAG